MIKLTFILLFTALLPTQSPAAQSITLSGNNLTYKEIFSAIEQQTGYVAFYNKNVLQETRRIFINAKNQPLGAFLNNLFKNQGLEYIIKEKTIIITRKASPPPTPKSVTNYNVTDTVPYLKGSVSGEGGARLEGAVVAYQNTQVLTNANGEFLIKGITDNTTLVISFVGYNTQLVTVRKNQQTVNIVMEVAENVLDKVTIGTGIFNKSVKSYTGAAVTVTAKELEQFGNRNLIVSLRNIDPSFNIIENNATGSDPNRLPDIQIRGNSSLPNINNLDEIVGLNTPLIILDGFQSTLRKMLDININDVESVTILKDAAATAIYGSRGANGVVVINTKLPKQGALKVSYRGDLSVEVADLSDYNLLGAREKLELENKVGLYNNPLVERDVQLKKYYNFLLNDVNSGVNTNWLEIPLRTGVGHRHNINLSGGAQAFRYSVSAQLNNTQGVMKGSGRNVFNGAVNLSYILKNVRFNNQLMISEGKSTESPYGSFSDYAKMNPYWKAYDDKGNALKFVGDPSNNLFQSRWQSLPTSPLYNASLNGFDKTRVSEIINNTSLQWSILKGLQFRAQFGINKLTQQSDRFRPANHTAFANYATADLFRKGDYAYGISNGLGYDGSLNLQYTQTFHLKHTLFAGVDYNIRQSQSSLNSFLAEGFTNPNADFMSMALQYAKDQKPGGSESLIRSVGLTGNINYIFDNRFFADASIRMDGSSQFGKNNRMAPFGSLGLGWNLHNESFLKHIKQIDRLKLRGSLGTTGSQNFSAYQALSTFQYYTNDRYFNLNGVYLMGIGNDDLKWQQTLKSNVGIDAEFFNSRLRLTADYYKSVTNNLLSSISLPASNGFSSYVENVGKMSNQGFEFKTTGFIISKPADRLFWSMSLGLIHNVNKIIETSQALKDVQKNRQMQTGDVFYPLFFEGYSTTAIWAVPSLGIDPSNGKEVYLDLNGNPTYIWSGTNLRAVGDANPNVLGNVSTMVRYKSFTFNAVFGYRFGGQLYNQTLISKVENADYKYNVDARVYDQRWQKPGDKVFFKGLMVTGATSRTSRFVQDENTLTCQNISLQYEPRAENIRKLLGVQNLLVMVSASDPFRFSSIRQERGILYPFSKQFFLSLNVTF